MTRSMIYKILAALIALSIVYGVTVGPSKIGGSHPPPKHHVAEFQIEGLETYYVESNYFQTQLQQAPQMDNATFVAITKLDPSVYKRNQKGEVLDPWGQPYVISRKEGQITITSPGLDHYNKLSSLQKWWSND